MRLGRWFEEDQEPVVAPPVPAPERRPDLLRWASAAGNQAVQRAAAQAHERGASDIDEDVLLDVETEGPEAAAEHGPLAAEPAPADFGPGEDAGLAALDELPEEGLID